MRDTIELAREAGGDDWGLFKDFMPEIERLVALVRADERNLWPAEMEAMERQVNILTDALADEREACAKVCDELAGVLASHRDRDGSDICVSLRDTIRARGNT